MTKEFINMNSLTWLKNPNNKIKGSVLIGPPDIAEIGIDTVKEYYEFLTDVANTIMAKMMSGHFLIVIMTDRFWTENEGEIFIDKTKPFIKQAEMHNFNLLFRKLIEVDNYNRKLSDHKLKTKFQNFSNIMVFKKDSFEHKISRQLLITDIFRKTQDKLWQKGVYPNVLNELTLFLKQNKVNHISDFFAGYGTTLLVAEKFGIDSFGIELLESVYKEGLKAKLIS